MCTSPQTDRIRYYFMTFYTYSPGPLHTVITLQGGSITSTFQGTWPGRGHTAVATHGAAARGSLRQQSPSWPHTQATKPRAALGELRASSEVNIYFIVLALEMAKENFSSATLSFFFWSPKQPTQILCETRRGINMEINDTEIPKLSRCHHYLLLASPSWTSAREKHKMGRRRRIKNSCVHKRETSARLFGFPTLCFTAAGTEHTVGI